MSKIYLMINSNETETNVMNIKNLLVWNCNKIENKIQDLFYTLDNECIDIIALNETKLDKNNEAIIMNHPNYKYVLNSRNKFGGGVGFVIKKHIKYEVVDELDKLV